MSLARRDQFTGSNNIAKPERLPEGAVVDAVNMDFTVGGKAELRTGFTKIRDGQNIRALFDMGAGAIAIVDGDQLVKIKDGVETNIVTVSPGPISAVLHNGKLFINTMADRFVVSDSLESWTTKTPHFDISIVPGNMKPGIYKIAVTSVANGRESGVIPAIVRVGDGQAIAVTTSADTDSRLYSSVANGQTLYYQGKATVYNDITHPVDDTERLETAMLEPLPFCENLTSYKGLILGSSGRTLYHTQPLLPHLHNPETDYIQFPSDITLIASVNSGIYVCADKTYFIASIGSPEMYQSVSTNFGAIAGTYVSLPNGSAAWFSEYGQVIAGDGGVIELINQGSYSPDTAQEGAAGLLEHNGNQMIVTTMRGEQQGSRLSSTDFWDIEVI